MPLQNVGKVITSREQWQTVLRSKGKKKFFFALSEFSRCLERDQTAGIQRRIGTRVLDPRPGVHL